MTKPKQGEKAWRRISPEVLAERERRINELSLKRHVLRVPRKTVEAKLGCAAGTLSHFESSVLRFGDRLLDRYEECLKDFARKTIEDIRSWGWMEDER